MAQPAPPNPPSRTRRQRLPKGVFHVDFILNHRTVESGETEYFVKWLGYGDKENSWVKLDDFEDPAAIIQEYFVQREKSAPTKQK